MQPARINVHLLASRCSKTLDGGMGENAKSVPLSIRSILGYSWRGVVASFQLSICRVCLLSVDCSRPSSLFALIIIIGISVSCQTFVFSRILNILVSQLINTTFIIIRLLLMVTITPYFHQDHLDEF